MIAPTILIACQECEDGCEVCRGNGLVEASCDSPVHGARLVHAVVSDCGEHYCRPCAIELELIALAPVERLSDTTVLA